MRATIALALGLTIGCASSGPPLRDAGIDARRPFDAGADARDGEDAGPIADSGTDAPIDDAALDAAPDDAGIDAPIDAGPDARAIDAGPPPPTIDGTIGATEWSAATSDTDATPSAWGAANQLRAIHALLRAEGLYLAIEGTVEPANAIVAYVDRARGTTEGVVLSSLTDGTGDLDDALSAGIATPADVRPDLGWGTRDMSRAAVASDPRMGWRDFVRGSASDFYWVDAMSVCGASACETFLPRSALDMGMGATRPRTVAIFARIASADGLMSPDQTLPSDDPSMPRTVSVVLELTE